MFSLKILKYLSIYLLYLLQSLASNLNRMLIIFLIYQPVSYLKLNAFLTEYKVRKF